MKEIDIIRNLSCFNLDDLDHEITEREILGLYKELVKVYHPDISAGVFKDGSMMAKLNGAKTFLIDNIEEVNRYIRWNNPKLRHIEEERMRAEAEEKARAEEEARRAAEEKRKKEEEEARRAAEEKRKREEAARKRRETIARKKAEEEARRKAEEEEAERKAEQKRRAEEQRKWREAEERRRKSEQEKRLEAERRRREEEERFNAMTPKQQRLYLKEKERRAKEEYRIKNADKIKAQREKRKKAVITAATAAVIAAILFLGGSLIYKKTVTEPRIKYDEAMALIESEQYAEAFAILKEIPMKSGANDKAALCEAMLLHKEGRSAEAALKLGAIDDPDAFAKSKEIYWDKALIHNVLAQGYDFCVGINADGSVRYRYSEGNDEASDKTDIISVAAGDRHAVGLKNDGTVEVIIEGSERKATKKLDKWENIVEVYAYRDMTVGLKADGTVEVANADGTAAIEAFLEWKDIVSLDMTWDYYYENNGIGDAVYLYTVVGATADGRFVSASDSDIAEMKKVTDLWSDVTQVSIYTQRWVATRVVALKKDGAVLSYGCDKNMAGDISAWTDVRAVHASGGYVSALNNDGTLSITGSDTWTTADVSNIKNAVYLAQFDRFLVVTEDGGVMTASGEKCIISDWKGIKVNKAKAR